MAAGKVTRFGAAPGAAGVEITETNSASRLQSQAFGVVAMLGLLKRGPMGICLALDGGKDDYLRMYGDPANENWHLFSDVNFSMLPDAIDGFYWESTGQGRLFVTRIEVPEARNASAILYSRDGSEVLKLEAANEGRWGGRAAVIADRPVVFATRTTFTIHAPEVSANEFEGAYVVFEGNVTKYSIVSNTKADPESGLAVFSVGSQYNLANTGVGGQAILPGSATYERYQDLTGTVEYDPRAALTGAITVNGTTLQGIGTQFLTELSVGEVVYFQGQPRVVQNIIDNSTAVIAAPYDTALVTGNFYTDNLVVDGIGTQFLSELQPGDNIYVMVGGGLQPFRVASIIDNLSIVLDKPIPVSLDGYILQKDGLIINGVGTNFLTGLIPGNYSTVLGDGTVQVLEIAGSAGSNDVFVLTSPLAVSFQNGTLTRLGNNATVTLENPVNTGLSYRVIAGSRYPSTHFGLEVFFNGSRVLMIPDASLDPSDQYFIEPLVNEGFSYISNGKSYPKWVKATSLWTSAYTTAIDADVRPVNAAGIALAIEKTAIYTMAALPWSEIVSQELYPSPYDKFRQFFRVKAAQAPRELTGKISSSGQLVTGSGTVFTTELEEGDYIYDPNTNSVRKITLIVSNISLEIESPFGTNIPSGTTGSRAGWIQVDRGYDLKQFSSVDSPFAISYPQYLQGGYDGDTTALTSYDWSKYADPDRDHIGTAVSGTNSGLVRILTPGISDVSAQQAFANYASRTALEYKEEFPSNILTVADAESFLNDQLGRNSYVSICWPSYGFISNPLGKGERMVVCTGDWAGGETLYSIAQSGYHFPYAGPDATLSRFIRMVAEVPPVGEGFINQTGIVPIKRVSGRICPFGDRAPATDSTYDFLHIRRIQSNLIRYFLEQRAYLQVLFKPNQPLAAEQVAIALENYMEQEYKKGVFTQYLPFESSVSVKTGSELINTTNSSTLGLIEVIAGKLRILIRYVPTGITEVLSIDVGPETIVSDFSGAASANSGSI